MACSKTTYSIHCKAAIGPLLAVFMGKSFMSDMKRRAVSLRHRHDLFVSTNNAIGLKQCLANRKSNQ